MAKKSSKSSRRSRAKKQPTAKKKPVKSTVSSATEAVVEQPALTQQPSRIEISPQSETQQEAIEVMIQPQRRRMLVGALVLGVVLVGLMLWAGLRSHYSPDMQTAKPGQSSAHANDLLQTGGNVCSNGANPTNSGDNTGSTNPQSVGMMLQNVPANDIQTPQGLNTSNSDLNTLQSASCY